MSVEQCHQIHGEFKFQRMSESVLESQDEIITRKAKEEEEETENDDDNKTGFFLFFYNYNAQSLTNRLTNANPLWYTHTKWLLLASSSW